MAGPLGDRSISKNVKCIAGDDSDIIRRIRRLLCAHLAFEKDESTVLRKLGELERLLQADGSLANEVKRAGQVQTIDKLQSHPSYLVYSQAASILLRFFGGIYEDEM